MNNIDDDDQLADAIQNGDIAAQEEFFNRHQETLIKMAMSKGFQRAEAEDLSQEALAEAYMNIASFRRGERLEGWLVGILRNMMRREWKRRGARPSESLDELAEEGPAISPLVEPSSEEKKELGRLWAQAQLYMTLAANNPKHSRYMDVLQLRLDGLKYSEIEDALGLGKGTAKVYYSRAVKILKQMLEADTPLEPPRPRR